MTRYRHRIIDKRIFKPEPILFAIPQISWNPHHEEEYVCFANGDQVRTNHITHDYRATICLRNLRIKNSGDQIIITCDNIDFECISPKAKKPTENKIKTCLERMQANKCPYKIARYLYPNISDKKHR